MSALHTDYRYTKGEWIKAEPPKWFVVNDETDWDTQLSRAGARLIDEFGGGGADNISIYVGPTGDYAVVIWDAAQCVARVFIDNIPDYLTFRSQVIAPQAMLIMECDRQFELEKQRAHRRAA